MGVKLKYFGELKMPPNFELIEVRGDGFFATGKIHGKQYTVISSVSKENDGNIWHHLSVASRSRLPSYDVLKFVKATFMRPDKDAIEVHAKKTNHINIHPNCRHLWSCLTADVLPDFTHGTGSI